MKNPKNPKKTTNTQLKQLHNANFWKSALLDVTLNDLNKLTTKINEILTDKQSLLLIKHNEKTKKLDIISKVIIELETQGISKAELQQLLNN